MKWFYDEEMEECACGYAEYVLSLVGEAKKTCRDPVVLIEQRLDFSRYVEEGFGTGDCVIIADGTLYIIDYKHGKGVEVSAEGNPQMMLYALGLFDGIYDIESVRMALYQPRRENVSVYAMAKADLLQWAVGELSEKAKLAYAGEGDFCAGEHCKFCKAKAVCRKRAEYNLELGRFIGQYRTSYFRPDKQNGQVVFSYKPLPGAEKQIYSRISDITISMKSTDHLQMPELINSRYTVYLSETEREKYEELKKDLVLQLPGGEITAANAASLSGKLSQMANGAVYTDAGDVIAIHERKLDALEDIIEAANGKSVLVAYWFRYDLERITERLQKLKIPCSRLDTDSSIRKWNAGEIPVALIHPASAGHGLNLQSGGNTLVWFGLTWSLDLRGNPAMYTVEMRIRGNRVRVYSGASYTLRFTASISGFSGGYAGYRSDSRTVCELLRLGDAWTYEPYERFDVTFPDGRVTEYGRIARNNAVWDEEYQVFTLTADVEEGSTRSGEISLDYDFFHSHLMELSCGNDYTVKVTPKDINIWISRLFLGDADGFSILYYQDVDSLVYWANEAAFYHTKKFYRRVSL